MNARNFGLATGAGGIGAGLYGLFGGDNNPADSSMKYLNNIPGEIKPYYEPYINAGQNALPTLEGQYGKLINNPGDFLNKMGSNFQQSPGFKFALNQALQGAGHSAAAGGMAGSPEAMQHAMEIATQLGNQDYYNWMDRSKGLYDEGLHGFGGLASGGFSASKDFAEQIAQTLASKAQFDYAGRGAENQAEGSAFGNLFGGFGALAAFL